MEREQRKGKRKEEEVDEGSLKADSIYFFVIISTEQAGAELCQAYAQPG